MKAIKFFMLDSSSSSSSWDRGSPLFQQNLVVEVVSYNTAEQKTCGTATELSNFTTRKQEFTLRILRGARNTLSAERALRFELSNEYNFIRDVTAATSCRPSNGCNSENPNPCQIEIPAIHPTSSNPGYHHNHYYHSDIRGDKSDSVKMMTPTITAAPRFSSMLCDNVELFELEVSEHDFQALRRDQALRIDFVSFADSIIGLLQNCELSRNYNSTPPSSLKAGTAAVNDNHQKPCSNFQQNCVQEDSQKAQDNGEPLFTMMSQLGSTEQHPHSQSQSFQQHHTNGIHHHPPCSNFGSPAAHFNKQQYHFQDHSNAANAVTPGANVSTLSNGSVLNTSQTIMSTPPYTCRLELWPNKLCTNNGISSSYKSNNVNRDLEKFKARLSIVESNCFRELTHISLNLKPGSGNSIQAYLSSRLVQMLEQSQILSVRKFLSRLHLNVFHSF